MDSGNKDRDEHGVAPSPLRLQGWPPVPAASFGRMVCGSWRRDSLQWTRISCLLLFGSFMGSLFTMHGKISSRSFMAACIMARFAAGLGIGQLLCRRALTRYIF
jgi:hypothetical protein